MLRDWGWIGLFCELAADMVALSLESLEFPEDCCAVVVFAVGEGVGGELEKTSSAGYKDEGMGVIGVSSMKKLLSMGERFRLSTRLVSVAIKLAYLSDI